MNPNSDLKLTISQMLTLVPIGHSCYTHFKIDFAFQDITDKSGMQGATQFDEIKCCMLIIRLKVVLHSKCLFVIVIVYQ